MNYHVMPGIRERDRPTLRKPTDQERIITLVAEYYGYPVDKLMKKNRKKELVWARQVAIYLLHKVYKISMCVVGDLFDRDHTTVIHSCKKVKNIMETEADKRAEVMKLQSIL